MRKTGANPFSPDPGKGVLVRALAVVPRESPGRVYSIQTRQEVRLGEVVAIDFGASNYVLAANRMTVFPGDRVLFTGQGAAEIEFRGEKLLHLDPRNVVVRLSSDPLGPQKKRGRG